MNTSLQNQNLISHTTKVNPEPDHSIVDSILAQAAAQGDSIAVLSRYGPLTYNELDSRSHEMACVLRSFGIGRESVVGICLSRSPALIVSALAVLRSGAAYLPMDPSDPPQRLSFLLRDSGARMLVSDINLASQCSPGDMPVIFADSLGKILNAPTGSSRPSGKVVIEPADLAYVIYTSGTTGQPKGVEITHSGLSNLIRWHNKTFQVTACDRVSQVARVSFDAAVWETWPCLSAGASLCLADDEMLNDPGMFRDWLVSQSITVSFAPTPLAEQLLQLRWPEEIPLRTLLTGGDTLHRYPPSGLPFKLVNNYGPTECTVVATSGIVHPEKKDQMLPSIGRPILGTCIKILDSLQRPVPRGTPGELFVGGAGVARGYRKREELTAQRFIEEISETGSNRFFRTGDLVQELESGEIAFIGRIDEQIKIRGFRIEPAEIVAALNAHPAISESAVTAYEISPGERGLVACFVPKNNSEAALTRSNLREFLSERLPAYMVPSHFIKLNAMPLNRNGKIDRAALPVPDGTNTLGDEQFVAPQTPVEKTIAEILTTLLGIRNVSAGANFFAMGGHSLLGTQLVTRLRDAFGVEIPLREVFEAPSVGELANRVEQHLLTQVQNMSEAEVLALLESNLQFATVKSVGSTGVIRQ